MTNRLMPLVAICVVGFGFSYSQESEKENAKSKNKGLAVNQIVPGPFYPFITHGSQKDRIRCVINEKAREKLLLIFIQSESVPDFLPESLVALDANLSKVPDPLKAVGSALVVWVNTEIKSIVQDDEKRVKVVEGLRSAIPEGKLQRIVLGVDDPLDLADYNLSKDSQIVVASVDRMNVVAMKAFKEGEANQKSLTDILLGMAAGNSGK